MVEDSSTLNGTAAPCPAVGRSIRTGRLNGLTLGDPGGECRYGGDDPESDD